MVVNSNHFWISFVLYLGLTSITVAQPGESQPYLDFVEKHVIPINKVPVFSPTPLDNTVLLENGYAKHKIINPQDWPPQGKSVIPKKIEIVFSQYPKNYVDWLTDYNVLLNRRLNALAELDSELVKSEVRVEIILQTDCENEFEAMQLYHGVRVTYEEVEDEIIVEETENKEEEPALKSKTTLDATTKANVKKIRRFMVQEKYTMDSTVYKILDRNTWDNAHLVLDWTGSMYGYGAEALLWHTLNESKSSIEDLTLFNDGDSKKNRNKLLGKTGGIYSMSSSSIPKIVRFLKRIKNKGDGGDSPENDMEALMEVLNEHPEQDIILLADNKSCIRDYVLLKCIDRPIHVILCDSRRGVNHQYLNLAWKTGGSIHTRTLDIDSINHELSDGSMQIGTVYYSVTEEGRILPVDRSLDRFQYCNRYYKNPKRRRRGKSHKLDCE